MRKSMTGIAALILAVLFALCLAAETEAAYRKGSEGKKVLEIQTVLKSQGFNVGKLDGIFGGKTAAAVKSFQRVNGLTIDGVVGAETMSALGIKNEPYTADELWLLAHIINGEGRGESYAGKVAIGAVVMNRVAAAGFPDTVKGVIFERGAFAAVADGQFYLEPYASCWDAAKDALSGADPTGGAIFYWNPRTSKSKWVQTLSVIKDIGNHRFAVGG